MLLDRRSCVYWSWQKSGEVLESRVETYNLYRTLVGLWSCTLYVDVRFCLGIPLLKFWEKKPLRMFGFNIMPVSVLVRY